MNNEPQNGNENNLGNLKGVNYKKLVRVLNKIGTALSEYEDIDALLSMIVDEIIITIGCDACSIYLREYNPDKLIFKTTRTVSLELNDDKGHKGTFKSFPIPLSKKSISGYVALTGEILNIADCYSLDSDKEYSFSKDHDVKNGYRTHSMLSIPMKLKHGNIIGVIQLINKTEHSSEGIKIVPFSEEYEEIISSIASQAAISLENVKLFAAKKELCLSLVNALSEAIESRSPHTSGHSKRVAVIVDKILGAMNEKDSGTYKDIFFSKNQREELKYTSLLHDIGKVGIPESILDKENKLSNEKMEMIRMRFYMIKYPLITEGSDSSWLDEVLQFIEKINKSNYSSPEDIERLNSIALKTYISHDGKEKPYLEKEELYFLSIGKGNLTKEERRAIEKHVKDTLAILSHIEFTEDLKNISRFAADHHEKIDGMGYPHGKKGDEITLEGKIIAIADIFEALTAKDRPYKNPMPAEMAMNTLLLEANDGKLDLDIVKFFISEGLGDIEY